LRRKGGIFLIGLGILLGFIGITSGMFIYWLTTFKIHIYQVIIEEYHYNRVQEIPLALISSDFEGEPFVERVNKASYGFLSQEEFDNFRDTVKNTVIRQVGKAYRWSVDIEDMMFGVQPQEGCRVELWESVYTPPEGQPRVIYKCKCSEECELANEFVGDPPCDNFQYLARCMGSLAINITFFNETFPFPLVFNGSCFMTKMRFNAYA